MTDQEFTSQADAAAAQDALIEQFGIEWLIGNERLNHEGSPLHREIAVTADLPNYEDLHRHRATTCGQDLRHSHDH